MTNEELESCLVELGLRQVDLAKLLGVTARAVNLWMVGDRQVPSAAVAYLRLLRAIPHALRQIEFARLNEGEKKMRDGMFEVAFSSNTDHGVAVLIFDDGLVYGHDVGNAKYDGTYEYDDATGRVTVHVKVCFPANGMSVFGIQNPYEWSIDVDTQMDPAKDSDALVVRTSLGKKLDARYRYLRGLPKAA